MRTRNIKVGQEYAVKIRQRNYSPLHIYRATIIATNQRRRLTEQNYWTGDGEDYANDGVKVRFHSHPHSEPITAIVRPHAVLRPWEAHEKILEERLEAQKSNDAARAKIKAEQAKKNKPAVAALDKAYSNNRKFGWKHSFWRQQLVDGSTSQVALATDIVIALAELQPRKKPAKKAPAKKAARKPAAKKATAKKAPAKRRPRQS